MSDPTDASEGSRRPGLERFARAWTRVVVDTSYVSMGVPELERRLRGFAAGLVDAIRDPNAIESARGVGVALVESHCTDPVTLSHTVAILGERLLTDLGIDSPEHRRMLARVQGALAAGYTQALQERTLGEQEAILRAALTARDSAEQARRASEARLRAMFAGAAIAIGIGDVDGNIIESNQSLVDMVGYSPEELRERSVMDLVHPDDLAPLSTAYGRLFGGETDHLRLEARFIRRDGDVVWGQLAVSLVRDDDGTPSYIVAMGEDVTERHLLQMRLEHQALHDPLTGLPNRAMFLERMSQIFDAPAEAARVGLCFIDLDGFKVINDSLGHDAGDRLLVAVAKRLSSCTTEPDDLLARIGGDEFVILMENSTGTEEVTAMAERVLASLATPMRIGAHALSVSASIGLVERPVAGSDSDDLMRSADITLHWAKSDGKARWSLFDQARNAREVTKYTLAAAMPTALERGEFSVDYQPLIAFSDGALLGVEAILRWRHPQFGVLTPEKFITLAEETGVIVPLGRWVLEQACQQAREWRTISGARPYISVNLSARQCRDAGLVSDVARILQDKGMEPDQLQLELTESALMGTADEPLTALYQLSDMGVRIAIDDFGTGYSNLAHLRRLPVNELKIAGSFIEGLRSAPESDPIDKEIIATLVSLAHTLGLTVIAEGVENGVQAERLRAIGCDAGQGWYFTPPGPPDQIVPLLGTVRSLPTPTAFAERS